MRRWIRTFYNYLKHMPEVTLIAGVFFGWYLQANVFESWLPKLGLGGPIWPLVIFSLLIGGWVGGRILYDRRRIRKSKKIVLGPQPQPRRGLILLLGRHEAPAQMAIEHHRPKLEFVWIIVTLRTRGTTTRLWRELASVDYDDQLVLDPWRPAETANAVERALSHARNQGLTADDIICDITGGTTAMTYGAIIACQREGIALEMVPAEYDTTLGALTPLGVISLEEN